MNIRVIYRLSDAGYKKEKPEYINNKLCLENASQIFGKENRQKSFGGIEK